MKKILTIAFAAIMAANAYSQSDELFLRGGTRLSGDIIQQVPGESMKIDVYEAHIVLPDSVVSIRQDRLVQLKSLDSRWQEWFRKAENVHLTQVNGSDTCVKMWDLEFKNEFTKVYPKYNLSQVCVTGKGAKIEFTDCARQTCTVPMESIVKLQSEARKPNVLTGVVDIIKKANGQVIRGQVLEQVLGRHVVMQNEDGIKETITNSDRVSWCKERLNTIQPLEQQVRWLDEVHTDKGIVTGVIIERNYGSDTKDPFIVVEKSEGDREEIANDDVVSIENRNNPKFKEVLRLTVNKGDVIINNNPAEFTDVKTEKFTVYVPVETSIITVQANGAKAKITIAINAEDNNKYLLTQVKKSVQKVRKAEFYTFSLSDILKNSRRETILPQFQTDVCEMEYTVEHGLYAFYSPDGKVALIEVK